MSPAGLMDQLYPSVEPDVIHSGGYSKNCTDLPISSLPLSSSFFIFYLNLSANLTLQNLESEFKREGRFYWNISE